MTRDEIAKHAGSMVLVTSHGDMWFQADLRPVVSLREQIPVKLLRLTKGGMALVERDGATYSVPPRNVVLFTAE